MHLLHILPIICVGAFSIGLIAERIYVLYWKYPIDSHTFINEIKQKVINNDISGAIQYCANQGNALSAQVAKAGLMRACRDNKQIQAAIEIITHEAVSSIRRRIAYLAMLANIATLFGLLGTIMGLIKAFGAVANVDAATKSIMLADGISTSMNSTALGLVVAIPTMVAFSVLQSKANRVTEDVESSAMITLDLLGARLYRDEWDENGSNKNDRQPTVSAIVLNTKNKVA